MKTETHPHDTPLHQDASHESAYGHVSGAARYVDDIEVPKGTLVCHLVTSPHAHARLVSVDVTAAIAMPGIHAVILSRDIPGDGLIGPIIHDEPLLADKFVHYVGHPIALVVGEDYERCRQAADAVCVEYEPLQAILSIEDAIAADSFLNDLHVIARGDVDAALEAAPIRIAGETTNGAQNHFYLETQAALVIPGEAGTYRVHSSTQHPSEVQKMVAHVLGIGNQRVVCEVPRMGGAFGGKESQATQPACWAALGAYHTGRPVKFWFNRDDDMVVTGHRHPFWTRYDAGFDHEGRMLAFKASIYSDGGWSTDLSAPVFDRALFHLDNAYFIPTLKFQGRACRTNLPSNTAFRGFGGPQGVLVVEEVLNRFAERQGMDPAKVRRLNFYGPSPRDKAPYGQTVPDDRSERIAETLLKTSDYASRRLEIEAFNASHTHVSRGIGFQPVKFGISFTKSFLNQAGALVLIYSDGTVQINHGGTEMGQGLHTKMRAVAAHDLGIRPDAVRVMDTSTEKVPNTSATAASSGSDLNGQAVSAACTTLRERMVPVAAELLGLEEATDADLIFAGGHVRAAKDPNRIVSFAKVATACWLNQVSLSATGYYRTPGIGYDHATGTGTPFLYFAYGGAVVEVEVHALTGEYRVLKVDILHDAGRSLVPSIDIGQVEGGFIQGMGWLTMEEVLFDATGRSLTTGPSTYKIPAFGDAPVAFDVQLLQRADQDGVIYGSKAVGEPPFMLATAVLTALRHAVQPYGPDGKEVALVSPCTPEAVLRAITEQRS